MQRHEIAVAAFVECKMKDQIIVQRSTGSSEQCSGHCVRVHLEYKVSGMCHTVHVSCSCNYTADKLLTAAARLDGP